MSKRKKNETKILYYKKFNILFYMGILLSFLSGIGSITHLASEAIVASSGLMGLVFAGFGYAGKRYFSKM